MANFIIIGLCILAGILFRKSQSLPKDAHKGINAWIIYIALPAVSFKYLPHITWTKELLFPALAPVGIWLLGWLFISVGGSLAGVFLPLQTKSVTAIAAFRDPYRAFGTKSGWGKAYSWWLGRNV